MTDPRFYMEHGVIHDRETGKHVVTDGEPPFEDSVEQVCDLLNSLAEPKRSRYFVSEYTDGPATRWNVIDRSTQEWIRRFATEAEAQAHADKLNAR